MQFGLNRFVTGAGAVQAAAARKAREEAQRMVGNVDARMPRSFPTPTAGLIPASPVTVTPPYPPGFAPGPGAGPAGAAQDSWWSAFQQGLDAQGRPYDPFKPEDMPPIDPLAPLPTRPGAPAAPTRDLQREARGALTGGGIAAILGALTGKRGAGAAALTGFVQGNAAGNEQAADLARQRWQDDTDLQERNFQGDYAAAQDRRGIALDTRRQKIDAWDAKNKARRQAWDDDRVKRDTEADILFKKADALRLRDQEKREAEKQAYDRDIARANTDWERQRLMSARLDTLRAEKDAVNKEKNAARLRLAQPKLDAATRRWLQDIIRQADERIQTISGQGSQLTRAINAIHAASRPTR